MRRRDLLLLPLLLAGFACGGGDDAADSASSTTAAPRCDVVGDTDARASSNLDVTLDEWRIDVGPATAGNVRVVATNTGDVEHELVLEQADGKRIGEIEPFASGSTCAGTFTLSAGSYTLLCEIVDESGTSHADAGMKTQLTVK